MISYDYYKVFYYVCKYKNFTKAANVLVTSQSSVSHTISNLEKQLGCRLFNRNNRGIELTPEGRQLYDYVSIGCEQFLKGENEILNSISLDGGTIYLGATETALHCFLFNALDKFHILHPNVKYKINSYSTIDSILAVKNGIVDMAITATPFDLSSNLRTISLTKIQDILIGGINFEGIIPNTLSLEELCNYPFITYSSESKSRFFMEEIFQSHNLILTPTIESATSDLILPMVKHGLGLGFIPEIMAKNAITNHEVISISTKEAIPKREICLVYDIHHPHSTASNEFIKYLCQN